MRQPGGSGGTPIGNAPPGAPGSGGPGPRRMNANKTGAKDLVGPKTGPIGASIVAISPRQVLDLNPALIMGKPLFESKGPPIVAKDPPATSNNTEASEKTFL
ncbi:hypothetical protein DMENIID0001_085640 [Sergentomyia squamirostris]